MERAIANDFEADLDLAAVETHRQPSDRRTDLPAALLIPVDPDGMQVRVCGVSVLSRLICSLDRASTGVHVLVPAEFPPAIADEARAAAESRPTKPLLRWQATLRSVPTERGLLVALRPAVIDHRICAAATQIAGHEDLIVRFLRTGSGEAILWYVGARRVTGLLEALTGKGDVAGEMISYLSAQPFTDVDPGADLCEPVSAATNARAIEEKLFTLGRKASDTWVARVFDRRVSLWFTRRLVRFPITPNQITVAATAVGLAGGLLMGLGTYWPQLIGAVLLTLAIIVDGCDGEIARIKYMESDFGRKLDFFLDNLVNVVAIFMIGAGHYWQGGPFFYLWASTVNAAAALGSVFPVYWLFFRTNKESVRLSAPAVTAAPRGGLLAFAEDISGRDFAYLMFGLTLIGRGYWFTDAAIYGLTVFFLLVLSLMLVRLRRPRAR